MGPNGAGKSTLLRLAAGLSRPTTGSISIFGDEVAPNSTAHLDRIGYFDQLRPLYNGFRVKEMLTFGRKLNQHWDDDAARQWLTDLDIPMNQRVGQLSLGQQAEVALTLCMGKRPDLLLLDEPVASLDPLARRQLLQSLMGTVAERGMTVFLSSHIVSELEPVIDSLLAEHRLIVGTRPTPPMPEVEVVSSSETGRQSTLLVHGSPPDLGPGWQVLEPGLDAIVLAYLGRQSPVQDDDTSPTVNGTGVVAS